MPTLKELRPGVRAEDFFTRSLDPEMERKMMQAMRDRIRKKLTDALNELIQSSHVTFDEKGLEQILDVVQRTMNSI